MKEKRRKLAAIMFTDIVGYTALMSRDESMALQILQKNRDVLKPLIEQFNGEWLKEIGDGTLSSFSSAVEAVNCALEIQSRLKDDPDFNIRIGIHVGDIVVSEGDIFGSGVNVASRIVPLAEPGGISITERVYEDIRNKPDIGAVFLGEKRLKNVSRPIKVYALTGKDLPTPPIEKASVIDIPVEKKVGTTISHYRILEKIGEGGMGVVYKAEDMKLKRNVALKFLRPEVLGSAKQKARFFGEAQAAASLSHPNICTIYEIDEVDGRTFIAMEFVDGQDLREKIESGPLDIEEALKLAIQIADGLTEAHEKGIVHRDIKSANIMVTKKGQAKIMDFGLAKMARDTQLTKEGTTLGTVAYMSPEQARGEKVDHRSDIWSLGVVMYEMLTGQRPFLGDHETAIIYSILNVNPKPPRDLHEDIPLELEKIIFGTLEKDKKSRYSSINIVYKDLYSYQYRLISPATWWEYQKKLLRRIKRPKVAIPSIVMILTLAVILAWFLNRRAKIQWAREQIPEIERLVKEGNVTAAYRLADEVEEYIPAEDHFMEMTMISTYLSVQTDPAGADIYIKEYPAIESDWQFIGQSPIDSLRMPVRTLYRWKIEKTGYETVMAVGATKETVVGVTDIVDTLYRKLDAQETIPSGMVRVSGNLPDFFIDKYEVSNKQYKEFLNAGGYQKKEFWKHKFVKDGRILTLEEAMAEFRDTTGRPGPATWAAGDYPDGQDDYPVTGVSWYEAAAYADFVDKTLPTVQHWQIASGIDFFQVGQRHRFSLSFIIPMSNFKGNGPLPIRNSQGMNCFGTYDMAGNVREWCWNETKDGRVVRGGAWNDVVYMYSNRSQLPPFDRSPKNGFRCVRYIDRDKIPENVFQTVEHSGLREYDKEKPVSDAIFQIYRNQFLYDKTNLDANVYETDESFDDWRIEKITFNAAYGNERVIAYLYLPKQGTPPYQTIVYFPGGYAAWETSTSINDNPDIFWFLDFILKNGRAVMYPVYKGTYERWDDITYAPIQSHRNTEHIVMLVKDFSRSIDYLETRPDIDSERLAFLGFSWGGPLGAIIPAVEGRLKANILIMGGFPKFGKARPEADLINYVSRVKIPTLMFNGRYDFIFPLESSVKPMYGLLGTPEADKHLIVYETDHYVPKNELIKETLNWLDRYLGPVR